MKTHGSFLCCLRGARLVRALSCCEGRISVLKRRHGLRRCVYRGDAGHASPVGLGAGANSLINIGGVPATRLAPKKSASVRIG
jgi:hypothetical protein